MMAEEHSFEAHIKTKAYQEAKERFLAKLARWGGVIRKIPGAEDDPVKRRAELQQQARELAAKKARVEPIEPITDNDIPF
jgi:hypothetical protein